MAVEACIQLWLVNMTKLTRKDSTWIAMLAASAAGVLLPSTAQALTFNFSYASGTTVEQMLVFETAGRVWSSYLTDDVEVNLYIEMTSLLPNGVIGGALPGIQAKEKFGDVYQALEADITSDTDWLSLDTMAVNPKGSLRGVVDGFEMKEIDKVNLTNANAKALGLRDEKDYGGLDGVILMNDLTSASRVSWNYDVTRRPGENQLDFLSVIIHEIGHNLGFVSAIDDPSWLFALDEARTQVASELNHGKELKLTDNGYLGNSRYEKLRDENRTNLLDAFRYTSDSQRNGKNFIDLSLSEDAYFSVDGGKTRNCEMSAGESVDSFQGSHWEQRDEDIIGIMDPMLGLGQRRSVTGCDLMAMDVIGWDLAANPPSLDLANLYNQSLLDLGSLLGLKTPTLEALTVYENSLTSNRLADVGSMLKDSEVYKWRHSGWWQNGKIDSVYEWRHSGWWQEADILQHARWQTLDSTVVNVEDFHLASRQSQSTSVPEPGGILGVLAMGLLGVKSLRQRAVQR